MPPFKIKKTSITPWFIYASSLPSSGYIWNNTYWWTSNLEILHISLYIETVSNLSFFLSFFLKWFPSLTQPPYKHHKKKLNLFRSCALLREPTLPLVVDCRLSEQSFQQKSLYWPAGPGSKHLRIVIQAKGLPLLYSPPQQWVMTQRGLEGLEALSINL